MHSLENVSSNLFQCFTEKELKGIANKCHQRISSGENVHFHRLKIAVVKGYWNLIYLNIYLNCKMSFENQINKKITKAKAKNKALTRVAPFLNKRKGGLLMNAFFKF